MDAHDRVAADPIDDASDERAELGGDGVAHGVGDVDGGGTGLHDRLAYLEQVFRVAAGGVHGAELQLRIPAKLRSAIADPLDRLGEGVLAAHPDLVLEVDLGGGDEHVEMGPLRDPDGLHGTLRVAVPAAGEASHRDTLGLAGDAVDRLPVTG